MALNPPFTPSPPTTEPARVYEAIFHPIVLEEAKRSESYKDSISTLALESVASKFKLSLHPSYRITSPFMREGLASSTGNDTERRSKLDSTPGAAEAKTATSVPFTLETLLSTLHGEQGEEIESKQVTSTPSTLFPSMSEVTSGAKRIQELPSSTKGTQSAGAISNTTVTAPSPPLPTTKATAIATAAKITAISEINDNHSEIALPKPQYSLTHENKVITVTIHLPGVPSVSDIDLDVSEYDLSLYVPGKYTLLVRFPCKVDDANVKASFNKQFSMLAVTLPEA